MKPLILLLTLLLPVVKSNPTNSKAITATSDDTYVTDITIIECSQDISNLNNNCIDLNTSQPPAINYLVVEQNINIYDKTLLEAGVENKYRYLALKKENTGRAVIDIGVVRNGITPAGWQKLSVPLNDIPNGWNVVNESNVDLLYKYDTNMIPTTTTKVVKDIRIITSNVADEGYVLINTNLAYTEFADFQLYVEYQLELATLKTTSTTTMNPISTPSASTSNSTSIITDVDISKNDLSGESLNSGTKAAIIISTVAATIAISLVTFIFVNRKRHNNQEKRKEQLFSSLPWNNNHKGMTSLASNASSYQHSNSASTFHLQQQPSLPQMEKAYMNTMSSATGAAGSNSGTLPPSDTISRGLQQNSLPHSLPPSSYPMMSNVPTPTNMNTLPQQHQNNLNGGGMMNTANRNPYNTAPPPLPNNGGMNMTLQHPIHPGMAPPQNGMNGTMGYNNGIPLPQFNKPGNGINSIPRINNYNNNGTMNGAPGMNAGFSIQLSTSPISTYNGTPSSTFSGGYNTYQQTPSTTSNTNIISTTQQPPRSQTSLAQSIQALPTSNYSLPPPQSQQAYIPINSMTSAATTTTTSLPLSNSNNVNHVMNSPSNPILNNSSNQVYLPSISSTTSSSVQRSITDLSQVPKEIPISQPGEDSQSIHTSVNAINSTSTTSKPINQNKKKKVLHVSNKDETMIERENTTTTTTNMNLSSIMENAFNNILSDSIINDSYEQQPNSQNESSLNLTSNDSSAVPAENQPIDLRRVSRRVSTLDGMSRKSQLQLTELPVEEGVETIKVAYSYDAREIDELTLNCGDIILVKNVFIDGWGWGVNQTTGENGVFPIVCLERKPNMKPTE